MRKRLVFALLAGIALSACSQSATDGPNVIGGDTNIPINSIGNDFSPSVTLGGNYLTIPDTMYITKNENGFITYKVWADLSGYPQLKAILPPARLDSKGNLNTEIHLKVTSEGIQDYRLADSDWSKPFTIVKYDCAVGNTYTFTPSDGVMITRTVTQKSTTDDFGYGFMLIKTNTTDEAPVNNLPGVTGIKYVTNHKFGLVQIVVHLANGTDLKITLWPRIY
jgi:hypothetical protein